jgi:hypothetical protein
MPLSALVVSYLATAIIFMMYAYLSAEGKQKEHSRTAYLVIGLLWPFVLIASIILSIYCFCSPRNKNRSDEKA